MNKQLNQNKPVRNIERSPVECWNCGKVDHVCAECWSSSRYQSAQQNWDKPTNRQGQSNDFRNQVDEGPS